MNELILLTVGQGAAPAPGGGLAGFFPFILIFVIFYFLLIRPQQKRQKQQQEMVRMLKKGDRIVTSGGVIGTVFALTESELVVEVADRVKLRVVRSQVNLYQDGQTEKDG